MSDLVTTTTDVLARMLRRLPPSLWDTDPASPTLQRDLYQAVAAQLAVWLEQREIARRMTLLLEAEGVDLDTLMEDYGLRRYLQRPDPYARQIAENILFVPQGTQYAIARLADLLLDPQPHLTMRTGRSHVHVMLAYSQPISTPYSYWGMISQEGLWYAVTVDGMVPTCSLAPPPGLDVAPGPHTLSWFQVLDELGVPWYVTIVADTLHVAQVQPSGYGTTEPFLILDGHEQQWSLSVDSRSAALVSVMGMAPELDTPWYWRVFATTGVVYSVWMHGGVPTIDPTPPAGLVDRTPGGSVLSWVVVPDTLGTLWYIFIEHDTLAVQATSPGGSGTAEPFDLLEATGTLWHLTVDRFAQEVVASAISSPSEGLEVLSPHHPFQSFTLVDSTGADWWYTVSGPLLAPSPGHPVGAADVTPAGGPYRWLRVTDLAGALWYAYPDSAGALLVSLTNPGGLGMGGPRALGDRTGVQWHWGVVSSALVLSDAPPVDYGGLATTVCLNDATGAKWFWRVTAGRLEWSNVLWPDAADQSPWGELGWLQITSTTGVTLYVFPSTDGIPTAALGPPSLSPWGWQDPVTLVDTAGQRWALQVTPTVPNMPQYWQVRTETGALVSLWVDAEVLALTTPPPSPGEDVTPGGLPLDWWMARDATGFQAFVRPEDDTVITQSLPPTGTGTTLPFYVQDALGHVWLLQFPRTADTLNLVRVATDWLVGVTPTLDDEVPTLTPTIALRDAVDAIGHIQPAGSLLTVLIT